MGQDYSFDDPGVFLHRNGYRDIRDNFFDVIDNVEAFLNDLRALPAQNNLDEERLAWDVCDVYFEQVASALKALGQQITLEFLLGGLSEEVVKMRYGDDETRPKVFPKEYTRMWLSNVP